MDFLNKLMEFTTKTIKKIMRKNAKKAREDGDEEEAEQVKVQDLYEELALSGIEELKEISTFRKMMKFLKVLEEKNKIIIDGENNIYNI